MSSVGGDENPLGHRLVIGVGGSGTTYLVESWVHDADVVELTELRGDPSVAPEPSLVEELEHGSGLIVAHDVHWLDAAIVQRLVRASSRRPVWASRRPWPVAGATRSLDDRLTSQCRAVRTAPLDVEDLAALTANRSGRAVPTALAEHLHHLTGGWAGPLVDVLDVLEDGWDPVTDPPPELVDRILRRVERAGPDAVRLARFLAVDPTVELAVAARAMGGQGEPERAAAAGGLLDQSGRLLPIVAAAIRHELVQREVYELHDQLAVALATVDRDRAADHAAAGSMEDSFEELVHAIRRAVPVDEERAMALIERCRLAGSNDPRLAVLEAELHVRAGRVDAATRAIAGVPSGIDGGARVVAAMELCHARWERVLDVAAGESALRPMRRLAALALAREDPGPAVDGDAARSRPIELIVDAMMLMIDGRSTEALRVLTAAADDEALGDDSEVPGVTATYVAGLALIVIGELSIADAVLDRGRSAAVGGRGDQRALDALHRYVRLRRAGGLGGVPVPDPDDASGRWERDRLMAAVIDAAIARRTGDLARLRHAWSMVDPILVRIHPSWLLIEPLTELLSTAARLGRDDRLRPTIDVLNAQAEASSATGPIRAANAWLQLHVALGGNDTALAAESAATLQECATGSAHVAARARASRVWIDLAAGLVDEAEVIAAADQLLDIGEGWEAARLAGQAALDTADSGMARRLLERARQAAGDPASSLPGAQDGLVALGLSEREAEVARRVASGRTHREIGAELYISPKTVEHHVARIRQKLGAGSRAELIAIVREHE